MRKELQKLPTWLSLLIGFIIVAVLGFVDYLTGDYSILIFYAIPVALVAWCVSRWGAIVISVAAGIARLISDYMSYLGNNFKYWNSLQDMVFLLMLGLLISTMKEMIAAEKDNPDE